MMVKLKGEKLRALRMKNRYKVSIRSHEVGALGLSEAARGGADWRRGRDICSTMCFFSFYTTEVKKISITQRAHGMWWNPASA